MHFLSTLLKSPSFGAPLTPKQQHYAYAHTHPSSPTQSFYLFPSPHKKEQEIWEKKPQKTQKVHIFGSPSEISKAVCLQILSSSPFLLVVVRYTQQNCGLFEKLVSVGFVFNLDKLEKI